jgi:hypothetical protein
MSSLSGVVFYLAGAIDNAKDDGVGWRLYVISRAEELNFGCKFFDPANKPLKFRKEIGHEKVEVKELKAQHRWKEVTARVDEFSRADLRAVDVADALIVYVDHDVHMCGSYFEVERAFQQGKPMFLIVKGGRVNCPPWLFSKFRPENMFDTVEDCLERLEDMSHRVLPDNWVLMKDWL